MKQQEVRAYYSQSPVVEHYADAAANIGLWISEEKIFTRVFEHDHLLLEVGCGAGRIAFGLHEIGFHNLMGVDNSKAMITEARRLAQILRFPIPFRVGDATQLEFEDGMFDGAIFGFNGLMQIPTKGSRRQAMSEMFRIIRPGGYFVFTAHDRENPRYRRFWKKEKKQWQRGKQKTELDEFGDRCEPTPHGDLYIHVPTSKEMRAELKAAGFRVEADVLRSRIANESLSVREFSDECRFWVARRPLREASGSADEEAALS